MHKRLAVVFFCLGLVSLLAFMAGCGKKERTIKTPEGEISVEEGGGGKVTFKGEEGETTYQALGEAPTEEELGAPIYPGAQYVQGTGGTVKGTSEGEAVSTTGGQFTTDDPIDKVISWYEGKLGAPVYQSTSPREASWMMGSEKDIVTVSVAEEDGKTTITIARLSGVK
ncbi:hypothetical protein [Candidatus Solincola tengchongensis]|uniref:hypothetical protein n=1 Tax=Candidatus Solincola tengchongensis TaxID=2900693 RepID=UPI00257D2B20|nr:hypothetical protein [Candidatus Solincola tengchongensis]